VRDLLETGDLSAAPTTRLDIIVFLSSFVLGIASYFLLRSIGFPQWGITGLLVGLMLVYAGAVVGMPRVRVRFDQAGDNAYYLGLLFTLVSMAFALFDFGNQAASALGDKERLAAIKIIGDFGIALATTITGIALRVVLHQMRVDPADIESSTRIELAEASRRVKAVLDDLSIDVGHTLTELHQRSGDQLRVLADKAAVTIQDFTSKSGEATGRLIESLAKVQEDSATRLAAVTKALEGVATEADAAMGRLRNVESPPLEWHSRLKTVADAFETLATNARQADGQVRAAVVASTMMNEAFTTTAATISQTWDSMRRDQDQAKQRLEASAEHFATLLKTMGETLERDRRELSNVAQESRKAAEAALQVGESANTVLEKLVELTRGLVDFVNRKS